MNGTHLCLIACRSRSAAFDELMPLPSDAVVAMLGVRVSRQVFDAGRDVALIGLEGAVDLACKAERVGTALEDLTFR